MKPDQWISVDKRTNKLVLRFKLRGIDKQFFIASGLDDTPQNRDVVRVRRDLIKADISLERFDHTLNSYQFAPTRHTGAAVTVAPQSPHNLTKLWELFTDYKSTMLEATTIKSKYGSTASYIKKLPTVDLSKASLIRDWLLTNTTHRQAWALLNQFSECGGWAVSSGLIALNPFENLKIKKPRRKSTGADNHAYSLHERDLIIAAFANHPQHSHHTPLIKFLFYTGARLGEAFALSWGDVSPDCTKIMITKSRNIHAITKGTKNGKRRIFPTATGSRLHTLLLEMRAAAAARLENDALVFQTATGKPYTSALLLQIWKGSSKNRNGERCEKLGVVGELAARGILPYIKPYSTRHTFATGAITSGVSIDKLALWIGDEVATVLKFYCHPNTVKSECPDF